MDKQWTIYLLIAIAGGVVLVMARLDRLGKQLEAVLASIRYDLELDPDRKKEIMREWKESEKQQAKDARVFWISWAVIGSAVALGWALFSAKLARTAPVCAKLKILETASFRLKSRGFKRRASYDSEPLNRRGSYRVS
jgi:hypothetical protein